MENFNIDELGKDIEKRDERIYSEEQQAIQEIAKYFDRIHDKILSINNIFIAAYLAIIAFKQDVSKSLIIVPVLNMLLLIYIDWRMMEANRRMASRGTFTEVSARKHEARGNITNLLSLLTIVITIIEIIIFLNQLS